MDTHGFWNRLNDVFIFLIVLWLTTRLFQRRLGWFLELVWGFVFFFLASFLVVYALASVTGTLAGPGSSYLLVSHLWSNVAYVFIYACGGAWVAYAAFTHKKAHAKAMAKAQERKAASQVVVEARRQVRRAKVRDFLVDVLPPTR